MKLIIELAEAEGLSEAVAELLEWHESPEHMLSSAGAYIQVMEPGKPALQARFAWRITGIEVERKISEVSGAELMAAIREETGRSVGFRPCEFPNSS